MHVGYIATCVQPPVVCVSIIAVSKDKCLHPPLRWFFWEILDEGEPALESNHGFVHRELSGGVVCFLKVLDQRIEKRPNFEEGVVTWLTFFDIHIVVI